MLSCPTVRGSDGGVLARAATMHATLHAPGPDRVRANTWPPINERVDRGIQLRLRQAAAWHTPDELSDQIAALDMEWDFERVVEAEASLAGLLGLVLGATVDRRFLAVPAIVAVMLLVHASQGWYPLLPIFRRLGVRTRHEIDRERFGVKAIRGDFTTVPPAGAAATERAAAAWKAVCA